MSLKVKFRTLFPAFVTAASPLTLIKSGLSYAFGLDITALRQSLDAFYVPTGTGLQAGNNLSDVASAAQSRTNLGLPASVTTDTTNPANINYVRTDTGANTRSVFSKLSDRVSVFDFIPAAQHAAIRAGTSTYDVSSDVQAAINAYGGKSPIYFPQGKYKFSSGVKYIPSTFTGIFAPGIEIIGDGPGNTILDNQVNAVSHTDTFDMPTGSAIVTVHRANHGLSVDSQQTWDSASATLAGTSINGSWNILTVPDSNTFTFSLSAPNSGATITGQSIIYNEIKPLFDFDTNTNTRFQMFTHLKNLQIQNNVSPLRSVGVRIRRSYQVTIEDVWIIGMTRDGVLITVPNETSGDRDGSNQVTLRHVRLENCGGWGLNCEVRPGNNELSYLLLDNVFVSACGTSSALLPPPSGGIHFKGQSLRIQSSACVINQNVGLFIEGAAGLATSAAVDTFTVENNLKKGIYITGIQGADFTNLQIYNNDSNVATNGFQIDGTNYTCSNIRVRGAIVRATSGNNPYTAFALSGANADANTCRVDPNSVTFQTVGFPSAGQTAFSGIGTGMTTQQKFLSGSGTYTTPSGVRSLKVRMLGGGGGGAGSGTTPGAAGAGGSTTFGSSFLTCPGGGAASTSLGGSGSTPTGGDLNLAGASGQSGSGVNSSAGGNGGISFFGGAGWGGAPGAGAGVAALANSGSGGGGGGVNTTVNGGGGGGASGYLEKIVDKPAATYAYSVGAGGTAGTAGTGGAAGAAGGSGIIIVDEYY